MPDLMDKCPECGSQLDEDDLVCIDPTDAGIIASQLKR